MTDNHIERSGLTLRDFQARIRRYNADLPADSLAFRAAVILLAGLEYGHNIDRIARRCDYERAFVARVARRLTDNGVWKGGVTVADWSSNDEASGTFWNDVAVAEGKMCRRIGSGGQIEWAPAGFWNKSFQYGGSDPDSELSTEYHDASQGVGKSDVDKSEAEKEAPADSDSVSDRTGGLSKNGTMNVETEVIGPVPGAPVSPPKREGTTVPPLDDLFRDVTWIG